MEDEPEEQDIFDIDPFDTVVGQDASDDEAEDDDDDDGHLSDISSDAGELDDDLDQPAELPTNTAHIRDMVKKLDCILTLIFDHFQRAYTTINNSIISSPTAHAALPPLPSLPPNFSSPFPTPFQTSDIPQPESPSAPTAPTIPELQEAEIERNKSLLRMQFHTLLSIFDRTILPTFKSRYTQFLIFWYTSLNPEFSDIFQGMLVDRALFQKSSDVHNSTPAVSRAAAASYIGSFVSRASFVDRDAARRVVGVLCEFMRVHLDGVEELIRIEGGYSAGIGGYTQNSVFYAVAQAVFLIFCFRWRDLQEDIEGEGEDYFLGGQGDRGKKEWMPQLSVLRRVVLSVLNPLKVPSSLSDTQC